MVSLADTCIWVTEEHICCDDKKSERSAAVQVLLCVAALLLCPAPKAAALRNDAVWQCESVCLSVCLSIAYIGPNSRTERPRKTQICLAVAHVTRDSGTTFKVKRSTCRGRGYIVAASHTACCYCLWWTSGFCCVSIDATHESDKMGRLVNHCRWNPQLDHEWPSTTYNAVCRGWFDSWPAGAVLLRTKETVVWRWNRYNHV